MSELVLPLTTTGRRYGYIIWPKAKEADVRRLMPDDTVTLILPGGMEKGPARGLETPPRLPRLLRYEKSRGFHPERLPCRSTARTSPDLIHLIRVPNGRHCSSREFRDQGLAKHLLRATLEPYHLP